LAKQRFRSSLPVAIGVATEEPGLRIEEKVLWAPCKGLMLSTRPNRIPLDSALDIQGFRVDELGILRRRKAIRTFGTAGTNLLQVMKFVTGRGIGYTIRFRTTSVDVWDGTSWVAMVLTPALTGTATDLFTWTTFNDTLLFSNGVDGIYKFDPVKGFVADAIAESFATKYLTTFASRVIASYVRDPNLSTQRIRWSVKNNSDDWVASEDDPTTEDIDESLTDQAIGAGFEDLLSTPGGQIDQQHGVWPISDTIALVLRSRSIWQMTQTGSADSPFRFTRLFSDLGTESPYSPAATPDGIIFLGLDDVYIVSQGRFDKIGIGIRDEVFSEVTDLNGVIGAYDPAERRYLMYVPSADDFVYEYAFDNPGWTRSVYPDGPNWISYGRPAIAVETIDGLSARASTIDGLSAVATTIDGLSGTNPDSEHGLMLALTDNDFVAHEDPALADDLINAVVTPIVPLITSGIIYAGESYERTSLIEVRVEYESGGVQTLKAEYSLDGGATFSAYGATAGQALASEIVPKILKFNETITHATILIRLQTVTDSKDLRIHSVMARVAVAEAQL